MKFEEIIKEIKFEVEFGGVKLAPAIVQDADKGDVLMMAWMNEDHTMLQLYHILNL